MQCSGDHPLDLLHAIAENTHMFLRKNRKHKKSGTYESWTLVETIRTARGPRQRIVATIGKLPGMDKNERVGWEEVARIVSGIRSPQQGQFFAEENPAMPAWATANLRGIKVERVRDFGDVFVGLLLWKKLELDVLFNVAQIPGEEDIEWKAMFCLSVLARLCAPSSELAIAERWYDKTALCELLGIGAEKVNDDRLYRTLDHLIVHKDTVCGHLQKRYHDLFGVRFDFLLYDVTSTYFEGMAKGTAKAKRGYSRDHRPDCLQVCIGLVVTEEGLPVGYEVFDGNRHDVTTLAEIVSLMEHKYGKAGRVWVFDRGIASEENIEMLRRAGVSYIVGTPKGMLRRFEQALCDKDWKHIEPDVDVKIIRSPGEHAEVLVMCKSAGRAEKERSMVERQRKKLEAEFIKIQTAVRAGRLTAAADVGERIGRWRGTYTRASKLFESKLTQDSRGTVTDFTFSCNGERQAWNEKSCGAYMLRTNLTEESPEVLWKRYMQLTQAENAFRTSKDELGLRPIYHKSGDRVEAHIFVCFLALALWRTLELWSDRSGLGKSPRKLMDEFAKIKSMDIVVPIQDRPAVRLHAVGRPDEATRILLYKMGIRLPNRTIFKENVVETLRG
jgi:transposase